jgi:uncharacterized protein
MKIGVIGASGNIGSRIVSEALSRKHTVCAFSRNPPASATPDSDLEWRTLDIFDEVGIGTAFASLDVVVSTYQPGNAANDLHGAISEAISDPSAYSRAARILLQALERNPRVRIVVIGGAGSLEITPGKVLADAPDLADRLVQLGLPAAYAAAVHGHRDALNVYRQSNRLWTYLSPAALIEPGNRTGRFRIGTDTLLTDINGNSRISYEDAAVAVLDEIEVPRFIQRRFTIAY